MLITLSFKKSLIVEQFQGNYLKEEMELRKKELDASVGQQKQQNDTMKKFME